MNEQLISFNTSVLAKEKGYPIEEVWHRVFSNSGNAIEPNRVTNIKYLFESKEKCDEAYHFEYYLTETSPTKIAYPTKSEFLTYIRISQSLLAKWLREIHRLHITIIIGYGEITWYSFIIQSIDSDSYIEDYEGSFNTYEEALEKGLEEALKLLT